MPSTYIAFKDYIIVQCPKTTTFNAQAIIWGLTLRSKLLGMKIYNTVFLIGFLFRKTVTRVLCYYFVNLSSEVCLSANFSSKVAIWDIRAVNISILELARIFLLLFLSPFSNKLCRCARYMEVFKATENIRSGAVSVSPGTLFSKAIHVMTSKLCT